MVERLDEERRLHDGLVRWRQFLEMRPCQQARVWGQLLIPCLNTSTQARGLAFYRKYLIDVDLQPGCWMVGRIATGDSIRPTRSCSRTGGALSLSIAKPWKMASVVTTASALMPSA